MPAVFPQFSEKRLQTVVGRPIDLPKVEDPSLNQVLHWHRTYVRALQILFDKYQPQLVSPGIYMEYNVLF